MTKHLRISLALTISALLALTGQSLAMSRGVKASVGQIVICTGSGPVVVHVDEDGQPTQAPHYCPDFGLSLLGAVAQAGPELAPVAPSVPQQPSRPHVAKANPPVRSAPARAPPLFV